MTIYVWGPSIIAFDTNKRRTALIIQIFFIFRVRIISVFFSFYRVCDAPPSYWRPRGLAATLYIINNNNLYTYNVLVFFSLILFFILFSISPGTRHRKKKKEKKKKGYIQNETQWAFYFPSATVGGVRRRGVRVYSGERSLHPLRWKPAGPRRV